MKLIKDKNNFIQVFKVIGNYTIQTITIENGQESIQVEYINQD